MFLPPVLSCGDRPKRSAWDDSVAASKVLAHRLPGRTPKKEHFFLGQDQFVVPPPEETSVLLELPEGGPRNQEWRFAVGEWPLYFHEQPGRRGYDSKDPLMGDAMK